jgi:predicted ATPase/class 3 adenylate cyclase
MSTEQGQLENAIQALQVQRALLGDAVVDAAQAALRAKLAALAADTPWPAPEPAQTLRQVSILFLDVVGSTTLSQHLDPETISGVFDGAMARGTAVVTSHRGKVLQYAGDSILAVFGAQEAQEDDAERAVQCGLKLLELGKTLGAEVLAEYGHAGFNFRVGIHTGGVVLGGGVDAERSIRGIPVSIAARMEQTAPAGALRISHDTYAQVRGMFEVQAQEPLSVKGVDTPLQTYLVLRAKPRQFRIVTRGIEGVATRMIGRDAELHALQAAFERLYVERKLAAVTVVADAGIGKSRLLYEFEAWSEARPERFYLFRGRATPQTGTQAYGLLRDLIAWRLQIADDDSLPVARAKVEQGVVPLFVGDDGSDLAEGHAHLLGHLIGIDWKDSRHIRGILDDSQQIRNRAFHAAAQLFRRVAAQNACPMVMQLEDLHWADHESLDFLNHLAEVNRDVPMLVLAFTRPTLFERRADWRSTEGVHQRIDLAPLGTGHARELAHELLKALPRAPSALSELLTRSAEGNPFYMEELLKMLIERGAIDTRVESGEPWKLNAERLLATQVPPTLNGVLQARLDGLPPREKHALQQASVVGAVFWDQALAAVDTLAAGQLPALVRRALTLPRPDGTLEGLREYGFEHQLLHQVTYGTVLKRARREGHARVARWLTELMPQGGLRGGKQLGLAAEHFERAGDLANAAEYHARAAEQAARLYAHERVLQHVDQALALLGEPSPEQAELRWRLLSTRELTLGQQARRDEQGADLAALQRLAHELGDDRRRAEVARRVSMRAMRMANRPEQERAAHECMAWAQQAGDERLRLSGLRLLAAALVRRNEVQAGRLLALQGLAEARSLGLREVEAQMLNVLTIAAGMQGDMLEGLELVQQALEFYRETANRDNVAVSLLNLGLGWMNLGDLAQARGHLESAMPVLRACGNRVMEGIALATLSTLALWDGRATQALALAKTALGMATVAQARDRQASAGNRLGDAQRALGRRAAARRSYTQARRLALEIDDAVQHDASGGLARLAVAEGDVAAAMAAVQPLLDAAARGHRLEGTSEPRLIELACHQALACAGDPRATDWLARAHTALMTQADAISDTTLRQGFLRNIPHHQEILAAWAQRGAATS